MFIAVNYHVIAFNHRENVETFTSLSYCI